MDHGHTVGFKPIAERQGGMIEVLRPGRNVAELQGAFDQIMIADGGAQLLELEGEIGILHLPGERIAERASETAWGIDVPFIAGPEEGRKKGNPWM